MFNGINQFKDTDIIHTITDMICKYDLYFCFQIEFYMVVQPVILLIQYYLLCPFSLSVVETILWLPLQSITFLLEILNIKANGTCGAKFLSVLKPPPIKKTMSCGQVTKVTIKCAVVTFIIAIATAYISANSSICFRFGDRVVNSVNGLYTGRETFLSKWQS